MNNELDRTLKEVGLTQLKVPSQHLSWVLRKTTKSLSRQPVSRLHLEFGCKTVWVVYGNQQHKLQF
jgi:hypothetical protein